MEQFDVTFLLDGVPLNQLPVQVGPFQLVWAKLPGEDEEAESYVKRRFGSDFKEVWMTEGFAALVIRMEAERPTDAIRRAFAIASTVADSLALRLGVSDGTFDLSPEPSARLLTGVFVKRQAETEVRVYRYSRELLGYIDTNGQVNDLRREFDLSAFPVILQRIPDSLFRDPPGEIHLRLRRALHWWAESRETRPVASKFLLSWTALESLITCPQDDWRKKGDLIKSRLVQLASKHGWSNVPQTLLNDLWHLRRELVHEAVTGYFDASAGHAKQIAGLLWAAHYFLLLAVIHAIDSCDAKQSMIEMWRDISNYQPPLQLMPDRIPMRQMFVEWMEGQEGDMGEGRDA